MNDHSYFIFVVRASKIIPEKIKKPLFTALSLAAALFPSPSWAIEEGFLWISHLPPWRWLSAYEGKTGAMIDPHSINATPAIHSVLVSIFLITVALLIKKRLNKDPLPGDRFNITNTVELLVELVLGLLQDNIGPKGKRFIPLIGTLALFILFSNLLGLIPGFLPPTDNINITAGCAIIVFFSTHFLGLMENGFGYLKHFTGPTWWLAPLMVPIEIIGHLARPLSLSIRLFGNITGDHLVLVIFSGLVPLVIPVFALFLGAFVSVIQALVFILLSMMYVSGATEHAGEH
jgi:F-type H+-transporting ATPase subunit a